MGDFFLDDQFFDHPKSLTAGEDAANLFPRILAWAHRHNTGHLPKNAVPTLTTKRNALALAEKLCKAGLLLDSGDAYEINDWYVRNAKAIEKREKAKKAAHEKWRKFREDAKADADAGDSQAS